VRQALENLLVNAVQHALSSTAVRVRMLQDAFDGTAPSIVISVADLGPGIESQVLPRLFDRFARSPNSAGLGIGLFLARQIVDAHGGTARGGVNFLSLISLRVGVGVLPLCVASRMSMR
jgi:signal transduction histidine kinase